MAFLSGYSYRKKITIDHTKVSADLSYFPTLVKVINDTGVGSHALSNGYDLRFTSYDGVTTLDYERESFTVAGGIANGFIWVKVPALSSSVDTVIYMYYGKADATDGQNKNGVWDDGGANNFKMVQHMNQDPSGSAPQMIDSTQYANNGTSGGTMTSGDLVTGQIDGATDFDGVDDYVVTNLYPGVSTLGQQFSWSMWSRYDSFASNTGSSGSDGISPRFYTQIVDTDGGLRAAFGNKYVTVTTLGSENIGKWLYIVFRFDNGTVYTYINGVRVVTTITSVIFSDNNTSPFSIGRGYDNGRYLNGSIDEVRISNTARSASWIATEYANQSSPSTFYILSPEEGRTLRTGTGTYNIIINPNLSLPTLRII